MIKKSPERQTQFINIWTIFKLKFLRFSCCALNTLVKLQRCINTDDYNLKKFKLFRFITKVKEKLKSL